MTRTAQDYTDPYGQPNWCPGCGDYGIMAALKQAMASLDIDPDKVTFVAGIGCGANMPYWVNTYGLITLHGRALPAATGAKLANHEQYVVAEAGDGDAYGIGMGHFIHGMRRNANIVYLVGNNNVYGLTKGQVSPTSSKGTKGPSTPFGAPDPAINPLALALSVDCSFVARGYAGNPPHLAKLIAEGFKHKGFSYIDILQPCVSYNRPKTHDYYQERVYDLADKKHDVTDKTAAFKRAFEEDKLPIGIFYKAEKDVYEEAQPQFKDGPLALRDISHVDVRPVFEEYS